VWELRDDKLNPIENRREKEYFVGTCRRLLEEGLWFKQVYPS
jgi:hypothetical protein